MLPRVLAWIATAAGLVLIVVLVTGGFRFEAGPLRVSAHGVTTPLLLMAAASVALAWRGSAHALDALSRTFTSVTTHAAAIAVISAAAIAGIGVGFGTYAASASDPSAYVSHSALIDSGRLSLDEPLARAVDWHEAAWTFSPLGYRPAGAPGTIVPGYPLGLPLVMAAARRVIGEFGPYLVGPALAVLAACARLRALGRRPILVVEDWEKPALRAPFPSGAIASLDWPPRAETRGTTRVGVWDPADRGLPAASIATDRLP